MAALVYLPALGNRFALDDGAIVERNAVAHDAGAALRAFTHPYWPPEHGAGLWRPVVILSFATDWQVSGGSPTWLHATNVVLHALVTGLVVLFLAPLVSATGALAGGLVFAVHPTHVEAVANLVGRAELLAAAGLLLAVLAARAVRRRRAAGAATWHVELGMLGAIALGLLSKEHAVIAVGLLWLDERAVPLEGARLPARSYVMVVALTLLWLLARRAVEGGLSFAAVAPTFFGLDAAGRVATMLPAVFVVLRLLLWPWDLSPDYHPEVIDRQEQLTLTGLGGLVVLAALVALAVALWRRHRPWSLGILIIGLAWLPTSNLLFPTGIALAERTLYASTIGLALIAALAADALARRAAGRIALPVVALGAVLVPCALKVVDQVPLWETTRSLVIRALVTHPESYKVHQAAARVFWRLGDRPSAMREYALAAELYPFDHFLLTEIASAALEIGQARRSLQYSAMSERLDADYSLTHQLRAHALLVLGQPQPALAEARLAVVKGPVSTEAARLLVASYLSLGRPDSARAAWPAFARRGGSRFDRWLLGALTYATIGMPDSAALALDSAAAMLPADSIALRRLREARDVVSRTAGRR